MYLHVSLTNEHAITLFATVLVQKLCNICIIKTSEITWNIKFFTFVQSLWELIGI